MGGGGNSKIGRILPKLPTLPRCIVFSPTAQRGRLRITKVWLIKQFETPKIMKIVFGCLIYLIIAYVN